MLCGYLPDLHARSVFRLEPKHFIGTWLGYETGGLQFARSELDPDGKGILTISYLSKTPVAAYRVDWSLNDVYGLTIAVKPIGAESEPITIRNVPSGAALSQLTFDLRGKGWNRTLVLFNAEEFQARSKETASRAKNLRDEGK